MHKTAAGERRKALKRDAQGLARDAKTLQKVAKHLPAARLEAQRLQGEADVALVEAEALKLQAKLEDLTVWDMKKVNQSRKGSKTYMYWMASWREGDRTRNVHLGSARKMDAEAALQKARKMKAEAIHVN
jgi:predicted acyl esterase